MGSSSVPDINIAMLLFTSGSGLINFLFVIYNVVGRWNIEAL